MARYIERCREHGVGVAGILAEGLWQNDLRSGFTLIDLSSGKRVPLAVRCAPHGQARIGFDFFPEGIEAGKAALDKARSGEADLIVVDEVGKLEVRGQGWAPYLPGLLGLPGKTHVWAVRKSLVDAVIEKWRIVPHAVVDALNPNALDDLGEACALF